MDVNCKDFACLQSLDLSYNYLSMKALLNIGKLQSLKELLLCGCEIKRLPDKFYESFKAQRLFLYLFYKILIFIENYEFYTHTHICVCVRVYVFIIISSGFKKIGLFINFWFKAYLKYHKIEN